MVALVAVASCAFVPGTASAGSRHEAVTHADRLATHAYLLDTYEYAQAAATAAPAMLAAFEGAANRIAGECPGALAGAPREHEITVGSAIRSTTARERGEAKRRSAQMNDLRKEVSSSLSVAEQTVLGLLKAALLAKLEALPSLDPAFTGLVHAQAQLLEEGLRTPAPDACADMRAWAASGYRTLSPASRTLALNAEAAFISFLRHPSGSLIGEPLPAAEGRADQALAAKTAQLELKAAKDISGPIAGARMRLAVALGFETYSQPIKANPHESKSSTRIGGGRTAAGTKYTVWLERRKGGSASGCKSSVEVKTAESAEPKIFQLLEASESGVCLSPPEPHSQPTLKCSGGLLKITTQMPFATRKVELLMSNGARIVSRPTLVPRHLGGPAAFYYQVVRGPSPIPVSLIERDSLGRTLRVVKLRRIVGCSKHPLKYLLGGKHTLVSGQAPQGPHFSIVGERYRLFGRVHSQLKLTTGDGLVSTDEGGEEGLLEGEGEPFSVPLKRTTPLDSEISAGCRPHEYSIFYGLLKRSREVVFVKISGKLVALPQVRLPASLHVRGVLIYLASTSQPEEIVVRSPSGKLVMSEDRAPLAIEGRETCEGESEGPGPTPSLLGNIGETSRIVIGNA